jgi:circadian clock protein KaiC
MTSSDNSTKLRRLESGVPGLDRVLGGGFFVGGVYIVEGVPGAGKTILANQICFGQAQAGHRVLYVTLLAESHARLIQHLEGLTFYDAAVIPDRLTYVSGFRTLEEGGLRGLLELVRKELRAQGATVVVLDGFAAVGDSAENDREFKKFVHELQIHAGLASCTFFLLSSGLSSEGGAVQPVHTMVDGLVRLNDRLFGVRSERELLVQKFRGSAYLRGIHAFDISSSGLEVHPRLEAFSADLADRSSPDPTPFGIAGLDEMLKGGLSRGSATMLLGPTGVGKSTLAYRFIASSTRDDRGLLFSFYETPKRAMAKAAAVGLPLAAMCEDGVVEFEWLSPVEGSLDAVGTTLLRAVDRHGAKRLAIDGFNAFVQLAAYRERVPQFFAALVRELHARGVTSVYTAELHDIFAPTIEAPVRGVSPVLENLILMRYTEMDTRLRRVLSILKLRDSEFDPELREFVIGTHGLEVVRTLGGKTAILTGVAKPAPPSRAGT